MTAREDLDTAITADCEGLLVTKWVLISEVMGADGKKSLEITNSNDLVPWDKLGMLNVALSRAIGRIV